MPIPKVLHQTWKTTELPPDFAAFRRSWQRLNPDWEFILYDDQACRRLVAEHFPQVLTLYDGYSHNVQRADLFRYLVVCLHGGIYADVDMECLRPLAPLLDGRTCVLGTEATFSDALRRRLGYRQPYQVANCIFAADAHHPFLVRLIERVAQAGFAEGCGDEVVENTTGPRILTRTFQDCRDEFADVTLLPQICWLPPVRPGYPNFFPFNLNIYCKHHFAGTWKTPAVDTRSWRQRYRERWRHPWPWLREDFHPACVWRRLRRRFRSPSA